MLRRNTTSQQLIKYNKISYSIVSLVFCKFLCSTYLNDLNHHSLTHSLTHSLAECPLKMFFWLLIWYVMDATPTNNFSVFLRTTVNHSQDTPCHICLWALLSPCPQQFDHLFVWILPFDLDGLVRPVRRRSFCQYSCQGHGITQAGPPLQGWWFLGVHQN